MVELLAPVGSFEALTAAIQGGCDSVYFGIRGINMRSGGKADFTLDELPRVMQIVHKNGKKAYLTLNTITYDHEKAFIEKILTKAKSCKVDAIIAWDFQVIQLVKKYDLNLHISTQASISNYESLNYYAELGATTAVLARELTLEQIKAIIKKKEKDNLAINIECFIHGAMCVAVSGRCFMSQIAYCKSANRGECLQVCRRSYKIIDEEEGTELLLENNYVMSPKDLCVMPVIDNILAAKINVLKIEGRMRSPEYVKKVVAAYREAINSYENNKLTEELKQELIKDMETVYNKGFSTGFYNGIPINEWAGIYGNKATTTKQYVGKVVNYYKKLGVVEVIVESNEIASGDNYYIIGSTTGVLEGTVPEIHTDDGIVKVGKQGITISFKSDLARAGDKLYKIIPND